MPGGFFIRRFRPRMWGCPAPDTGTIKGKTESMPVLRIVDSITELKAADKGCIAVSGSHGGLSSARYSLAARPLLSVFNDGGGGLDNAGLAALDFLQSHGLAACTVAHHSARIGEAQSTLASGVVSHANALAAAQGIQAGWTCQQAVDFVVSSQES